MEKSLFQKIKETQYFIGYLSTSILFVVLGAVLTTKIGFPNIEARLDYASFVIGLGTMTLFTYNLKGNEFVKVRDGSAKIAFLFLLIMTFNMVFNDLGENNYGRGYIIIPTCISLVVYLVAFVVKVYIKPYVSEEKK